MLTATQILADLLRIDTVNPPGNEMAAALYLKKLFDEAGIANEILEPEKDRASFFARLGSGGPRKLLFLSHTDVVPVGEGWDFDPFGAEISNGRIYGRGARDCKSLVAAGAHALLKLAAEGVKLQGELIFAATADEERAGILGVKHIMKHAPEKLQADFAINEGGEEPVRVNGRPLIFLQVGEKGTAWSRLKARGKACHGSMPTLGDNAVLKMVRGLEALSRYRPQVQLIPEVRHLLQEVSRLLEWELPPEEQNVDLLLEKVGEKSFAETLRSMTRMTVSPNVIQGGTKTNVVPDYCQADVDIRILPGQDKEYVFSELQKMLGDELEITMPNYHPPTFSTAASEYYRLVEETTLEVAGEDIIFVPQLSPWATDSRFLREAGIPAYGLGLMDSTADPLGRTTIHGKNEYIDLASLDLRADFLFLLARKYLL